MDKNILVQYDGGGYDGCIWEWNFFYIDQNGGFENIHSSGSGGIMDLIAATELIENGKNSFSSRVFIYHLDNEDELTEFANENNVGLIAGVVKWFNDYNVPDVQPFAICSGCGQQFDDYDDICLEDFAGCGGIAISANTLLCYECRSANTCDCCSEYVGESEIIALYQVEPESDLARENKYTLQAVQELIDDSIGLICSYCLDDRAGQIEQNEHEDLRWQSFATGMPDMFSDEMRWLWAAY